MIAGIITIITTWAIRGSSSSSSSMDSWQHNRSSIFSRIAVLSPCWLSIQLQKRVARANPLQQRGNVGSTADLPKQRSSSRVVERLEGPDQFLQILLGLEKALDLGLELRVPPLESSHS